MDDKETLMPLPPGVVAMDDPCIGVSFIDTADGKTVYLIQHPKDHNPIRQMVWQLWRKRHETDLPPV
jgi:hypothetical protein